MNTSVNDILDGRKDVGKSELAKELTDLAVRLPQIKESLCMGVTKMTEHIKENLDTL